MDKIRKNEVETKRDLNILNRAINDGFIINRNQQFENVVSDCIEFLLDSCCFDLEQEVKIENNSIMYCDENGYEYLCSGEFYTYEDEKNNRGKKLVIDKIVNSKAEIVYLYVDLKEKNILSNDILNAIDNALRNSYFSFEDRLSSITDVIRISNDKKNAVEGIMQDYDCEYESLPRDNEVGVSNKLDTEITEKYIRKISNLLI